KEARMGKQEGGHFAIFPCTPATGQGFPIVALKGVHSEYSGDPLAMLLVPLVRPNAAQKTRTWGEPMHKNSVLAVSALVVALSASALADDKDKQDCANKDPDRAIRGCTAIIEHGNETPNIFATAFANRGVAYARKKDYDRAIADFTRAI